MKKLFYLLTALFMFVSLSVGAQSKVYTKGGVFYIVDVPTGKQYEGLSKDVLVVRSLTSSTDFYFRNVNGWKDAKFLNISSLQDELGDPYTTSGFVNFVEQSIGIKNAGTSGSLVSLATNDMGRDAWGRPKMITDRSILHGMFTYNVPVNMWKETFNGTERTITNATSVNGKLNLTSGATLNDKAVLDTYRNPRYEPNRGHLYSSSTILPNPAYSGSRKFGSFTDESGSFFNLRNDSLFAVVRTTVSAIVTDDERYIDTSTYDLSKGNIYDIQMQWRGVGNYKFFINLKLVKTFEYLGTRTELTMFNPANPISFECENLGNEVVIQSGCVDITSEGGSVNGKMYGSIGVESNSGQVAVTGYNVPIIVVRSKKTVGGKRNTRDVLALLATGYSDQRSMIRIWTTRDDTAITLNAQTWTDYGDGHLEYLIYDPAVASMTFDTTKAKLVFGSRVGIDESYGTSALFEGRTSVYQTPGDIFIFTMHRETGGAENSGVTYEFAEEI